MDYMGTDGKSLRRSGGPHREQGSYEEKKVWEENHELGLILRCCEV